MQKHFTLAKLRFMLGNNSMVRMKFLIPIDIVKRIVKPIKKSKRNLTSENLYTSIPHADYLLDKKNTLTGILRVI